MIMPNGKEIYMTKAPNILKNLNVGLGRTSILDGQSGQSNNSPDK